VTIRTRRVLFVVFLSVLPSIMTSQATTPTKPTAQSSAAVTTGKNIGTIISTAFDTAFPIVGKVMDLFKSKPADTTTQPSTADKKKKTTSPAPAPTEPTATQSEVQTAVSKAQSELKTTIKEQIQPTATIARELGVIQIFASNGAIAQQNIVAIKRMLADPTPDYSKIKTEWTKFNNQIADILTVSRADIQLVRDVSIQGHILDLQATRKQLMVDITDNIERAVAAKKDFSKTEFEGQISAMGALLNGFDSLAAAEIGILQSDINNLAIWANSPAGSADFETKPADPKLLQVAATAIAESKAALHTNSQ
jgi:hypothetical protein